MQLKYCGDIPYKLLRKSLPKSFYRTLQTSQIGRATLWEKAPTYRAIVNFYSEFHNKAFTQSFNDLCILEIGSGIQPYTAFHLIGNGAQKVICVEPKLKDFNPHNFKELVVKEIESFPQYNLTWNDFLQRTHWYASTADALKEHKNSVDTALSHLVFEHIGQLEEVWNEVEQLLTQQGKCLHRVDTSDHTYHAFFAKPILQRIFAGRDLCHLHYSDKTFAKLNDPKCWMNRRLLPEYRAFAKAAGFDTTVLRSFSINDAIIHSDILKRNTTADPSELHYTDFVISHQRIAQDS